ncbi:MULTISPECIES: hypothetical protein [unclassified Nodularia (in: cyanobacteria)]|uniref:hypothetical protein n=1 Tax=unclassified Nodularia (in: cyanobacteria) TaxID=2656917 RepID=UPI00188133E0|nr:MULTISPECIES: hypothetical protein [unclassified Nodularia (in: cyanobacteria)]MBE9199047.1 hypothetical protein [Nodularia sp. LEGE 06071]MCC2694049.1 hypothetical protein [Nodularia sp. LEGE 04288]
MKIRFSLVFILSLLLTTFPFPALANAATPLIWTQFIYLIFGNAVIAVIEGRLLSKWFHTPNSKTIVILIFANYTSAWVGVLSLARLSTNIPNLNIENIRFWLSIFVVLAFLMTLIIEYPFFWLLFRKQPNSFFKALKATFIIHGISYLLLLVLYGLASQTSMLTQLDVVSASKLQPREEYVLYFISAENNQPIRSNLLGKLQQTVQLSEFDSVISRVRPPYRSVRKLTENTNWEYRRNWHGGISGHNKSEDLRFQFSLETPLAWWRMNSATHLEGDFVVFQLGKDQICILHPEQRKIALIVRGNQPVIVKFDSH